MAERKKPAEEIVENGSGKKEKLTPKSRAATEPIKKGLVLVTGAGGFVGQHVVKEALEQDFSVRATDLPAVDLSWAESLGAEVVHGDLTVTDQVEKLIKGCGLVAHIAAAYNLAMAPEELLRINRGGTRNLVEAAASAGVKHFVNCSTADTYGKHKTVPIKESFQQNPVNAYAFSKLIAEQVAVEVGAREDMPVTILRPTLIYGPGSVYIASLFCTLPIIVNQKAGFFPKMTGGPLLNAIHVKDMAGATVFVLSRPEMAGEAYNVADDHWQSVGEFMQNLGQPLGVRWSSRTFPLYPALLKWGARLLMQTPEAGLAAVNRIFQAQWSKVVRDRALIPALDPRFDRDFLSYGSGDHVYDNAKLKAAGYVLHWPDFRDGWRETIQWYKQQAWIPSSVL